MMRTHWSMLLCGLVAAGCSSDDTSGGSGGSGGVATVPDGGGEAGSTGIGHGVDSGPDAPPPVTDVTPPPPGERHQMLSDWNLFADIESQEPMPRVVPFMVNSILFSDYTVKHRFMWIPEGTTIGYHDVDHWEFPVGTVLVKTFTYPDDQRNPEAGRTLLETRLLVRETETAWKPHTYVFDGSQSDAVRKSAGDTLPSSWIHFDGETRTNDYGVPENNACEKCHGAAEQLDTLGGRTRQLNRDFDYGDGPENQIDHIASLGMLDVEPPAADQRETLPDPMGTASVSDRARSYMDSNCGHCHGSDRFAGGSGFFLDWNQTDPTVDNPTNWGVCKVPTSAGSGNCGLSVDVAPGLPDESIIVCRMDTRDISSMMPPLATKIVDDEGVALIREWIAAMDPTPCQ